MKLKRIRFLNRNLVMLVLVIILLGQIMLEVINSKEEVYDKKTLNQIEDEVISTDYKDLDKLINELNYNNILFSEIRKEENGYNIKVIVEGNLEAFKEKLKYINKYSIKEYKLKVKNDNIKVIATLNY